MKKSIITASFLGSTAMVYGQEAAASTSGGDLLSFLYNNIIFILAGLVVLGIFFTLLSLVNKLFELQRIKLMQEQGIEALEKADLLDKKPLFTRIYDWAWSIVPVGDENKVDLGHNYDGIRELDNRLPPWWLAIMYGTMIWAVVYMYYYHWSGNEWSSQQEYEMEMEMAEEQKARFLARMANAVDEKSVTLLTDEKSIAEGLSIYTANCLVCHGSQGEGLVGPNFADDYWIHGGDIKDLFRTIKYGVPEKGMISWKSQLRPADMQKVASYILTFQGTNPPNQKAPEGELYVPATSEEGEGSEPEVLDSSVGN